MKIGLLQYNPEWEKPESNKEKIISLLNDAPKDIELLIFPEMTLTGFTMKANEFAEEKYGNQYDFFSNLSVEKNCNIVAGVIEKIDSKHYNSIWHFDNSGDLISYYHKIHPFSYSGEDKNYNKGNTPVMTFFNNLRIGLSICYDLRFPELFRIYAKERVDLITVIANWPISRIEHWCTLLEARAIENQCYVAGVNRIGSDPKNQYNGLSSVFDPMGKEIITSENAECVLVANINPELVTETRNKLPFLNDIVLI